MARRYAEKSRRSGKRIRVVDVEGSDSKNAATSLKAGPWKNPPIVPSLDRLTVSGKTTGSRKLVFPQWGKHKKNSRSSEMVLGSGCLSSLGKSRKGGTIFIDISLTGFQN